MNSKNIQNLIFGTPRIYLIFLFCVGLTHAQRVDVVDHLGNKAQTGTEVEESATGPTSPKEGDIWINTNKTPNTTNIYDFDTKTWKEVKPSYQSVLQDIDGDTKIQLDKNKADNNDEDTIRFDTDAKERMVIRDDGKVGIGISKTKDEAGDIIKNPHINGELHINDKKDNKDITVRIQNSTVDEGAGSTATLRFSVTTNSSFDSAFVGSDRTNSLILGSNDDERMRIDEFGNVGIGRVPSEFHDGFHALQVGGGYGEESNGITIVGKDASIGTGYYLDGQNSQEMYLYDNTLKEAATMLKMSNEEFSFSMAEKKEGGFDNEIEWKEIMKIEDYKAPIITTTAANGDSGLRLRIVGGGEQILRIQDGNVDQYAKYLMTIDKDGNLLVGTTESTLYNQSSDSGFAYQAGQALTIARSNGDPLALNRLNTDGSMILFQKNGSSVGSIGAIGGDLTIGTGDTALLFNDASDASDAIQPCNISGSLRDNAIDLGTSIIRFKNLYRSGSIYSTSDRNMKQDIRDLTDAERNVAVACKGLLKAFRFIDAVEKDGDDACIHFGVIAQELAEAFAAEGLDANDYQVYKSATYTDEDGNEQTRLNVCYENLLAFIISAI
jgi:hypothetical protein